MTFANAWTVCLWYETLVANKHFFHFNDKKNRRFHPGSDERSATIHCCDAAGRCLEISVKISGITGQCSCYSSAHPLDASMHLRNFEGSYPAMWQTTGQTGECCDADCQKGLHVPGQRLHCNAGMISDVGAVDKVCADLTDNKNYLQTWRHFNHFQSNSPVVIRRGGCSRIPMHNGYRCRCGDVGIDATTFAWSILTGNNPMPIPFASTWGGPSSLSMFNNYWIWLVWVACIDWNIVR